MIFLVDLDGTLLNNGGELEKTDAEKLIAVQEAGHTIIVCTGRTETEAKAIIEQLEIKNHKGAVVLADGQYIIDYQDNTRLEQAFLNHNDVKTICNCILEYRRYPMHLFCGNEYYSIFPNVFSMGYWKSVIKRLWLRRKGAVHLLTLRSLRGKTIQRIEKMTVASHNDRFIYPDLMEEYEINYVHDTMRFEIKRKGVNKATAARIIIEKRRDRDKTFAFGNDENDICLLKFADTSYAVADAPRRVQVSASFVLNSTQHAVADEIERICRKETEHES